MPTRDRERRWPWTVAGYALLFAIVAAAAGFVYDSAAPAHRTVVIRLAVAVVLAVALTPPAERGWPGRGPSRQALAEIIDRIEGPRGDKP